MINAGGIGKGASQSVVKTAESKVGSISSNLEKGLATPTTGATGAPSFEETLGKINGKLNTSAPAAAPTMSAPGKSIAADPVKFSNHAVERMVSRGIRFSPQDLERINEAVGRAQAKGSKDSLILMNDSALIVSVKNKTVVTVMDKAALKENVFTNIDSTIVM